MKKLFIVIAILSVFSCDNQTPAKVCSDCVEIIDPEVRFTLIQQGRVLIDRRFMTEENIMRVEELVLSERVNSAEDLPKFKNLKKLSLYEVASLETINLGMWPKLEEFSLKLNGHVSRTKHIETGGATKLKVFDMRYWTGLMPPYDASVSFSKIYTLDFSKNPELHTLELHGFLNLKTLDFENNRKLSSIKLVNMASLTSIDLCKSSEINNITIGERMYPFITNTQVMLSVNTDDETLQDFKSLNPKAKFTICSN